MTSKDAEAPSPRMKKTTTNDVFLGRAENVTHAVTFVRCAPTYWVPTVPHTWAKPCLMRICRPACARNCHSRGPHTCTHFYKRRDLARYHNAILLVNPLHFPFFGRLPSSAPPDPRSLLSCGLFALIHFLPSQGHTASQKADLPAPFSLKNHDRRDCIDYPTPRLGKICMVIPDRLGPTQGPTKCQHQTKLNLEGKLKTD